ncbi:MAG: DUF4013 domain-containing protein [Anaerolineae bacterium]|nr:DUF4013 domain-containing protein [Anaerolineae bacterium]MCZ7551599.1 DUF4013 domain-containing protein [Anaerolineales bacterium]
MDIGKSLQFAFDDENWLSKLGLGALISLIPILNFAWVGYYLQLMRNVSDKVELPLPQWDEFAEKFTRGLLVTVAGFIYALPGILFLCLPIGIISFPLLFQNSDVQETLAVFTTFGSITLFCCIGLYFLVFSFYFPAVQLHYSHTDEFKSCFEIREILSLITSNLSDYLVAWLVTLAAGVIVGVVVGVIGMFVGWIPCLGQIAVWALSAVAGAWVSVVYAHIFGQIGAKIYSETALSA